MFRAGQYFFIEIPNPPFKDERGNRRHFSFVNSPSKSQTVEMATRIGDSAFKKSLAAMEIGRDVEINSVSGTFTLPKDLIQPLCFIAGGIGITPFMSMIKHLNELEFPGNVVLLYSNKTKEGSAFLEELQLLAQEQSSFHLIPTMTEDPAWQGETRLITASLVQELIPDYQDRSFFIAGTPGMVDSVNREVKSLLQDDSRITIEHFPGY